MNEIQREAFQEGFLHIGQALQAGASINLSKLTFWVNQCLANDRTIEKRVQLHDRDEDGNLTKTTTVEGGRSELAGYRLIGAFNAVESARMSAESRGVTFSLGTPAS